MDVLFIVVDSGIDHTVANCFGHNLLSFLHTLKAQLLGDVGKRDLGVADVDLLQTELDDSMLESMNKAEDLISFEHRLVASNEGIESLHITLLHKVDNLVVRVEVLREFLLIENLAIRNLTHQELYNNEKLLGVDAETNGANLRSLAQTVDKASLCLRVLELNSLNASLIVEVSGILVVRDAFWELSLDHEVAGLLVKVLLQVHANNDVHSRSLTDLVLVKTTVLVSLKDEWANLSE